MKSHHLNVHYTDYDAVRSRSNNMLLRRDLGFQVGDHVLLTRFKGLGTGDADRRAPILECQIEAITKGGRGGLLPGYVVLSLTLVTMKAAA